MLMSRQSWIVSVYTGDKTLTPCAPYFRGVRGTLLACFLMLGQASAQVIPEIRLPPEIFQKLEESQSVPTPQESAQNPNRSRPQRRTSFDALFRIRSFKDLEEEFRNSVTISGRKIIGFHLHQIEGDRNSFRDQNYFGEGGKRFTDNTDLSIRAHKFLGFLSFDWYWSNNRFRNPFDTRITYEYESPNFNIKWGHVSAVLGGGNPLASFNRTLNGVVANFKTGRSALSYFTSETKADARTITITGNDSPGPYYLQGSQIVDGSERVQVDGIPQRRGEDYTIDYYTGTLRFRDGLIIPRTSTIVVTYETYAFNSQPSRLEGWRLETNLGRGYNLGINVLSQKAKVRTSIGTRTQQFYGRGAPSVPYDLDYPPQPNTPITITVGGVPQQEGIDYEFDPVLPYRFYFKRFIPSTLIVQVVYVPLITTGSTIGGDREVIGLDFTLPLGKDGNLVWNLARSRAEALNRSLNATAQVIEARFKLGNLSVDTTYRDIPAEFIGIESVGFRRNERGHQTQLRYTFSPISRLQVSLSQARVASFDTGSQLTASTVDTDIQTYSYTYSPENGFSLSLNRNANQTRAPGNISRQTRDTVSIGRNWKTLTFSVNYDRQHSEGQSMLGGGARQTYQIQSLSGQLEWRILETLSLRATASQSQIRQISGTQSASNRARDLSISASWRPSARLSLNYRWNDTDSGTLNTPFFPRSRQDDGNFSPFTPGFQNPWGVGYNGNGFSSGAPLYSGFTYYGVRGKGQEFSAQWMPFDNLSFDFQWNQQRAVGDLQTNSAQEGIIISATYSPLEWLTLSGNWMRQTVNFLTSPGSSDNEILSLSVDVGPIRRWQFTFSYYQMSTRSVLSDAFQGGQGSYVQEPRGFSARATYDLGRNHNLFAEYQFTRLSGYLASQDTLFNIGYEYRFTRNLAFVLSYRFREQRNADPQYSIYNYRARSLDASINFVF